MIKALFDLLFVSDVIIFRHRGKKKDYYVDSVGFKEIKSFLKS